MLWKKSFQKSQAHAAEDAQGLLDPGPQNSKPFRTARELEHHYLHISGKVEGITNHPKSTFQLFGVHQEAPE